VVAGDGNRPGSIHGGRLTVDAARGDVIADGRPTVGPSPSLLVVAARRPSRLTAIAVTAPAWPERVSPFHPAVTS